MKAILMSCNNCNHDYAFEKVSQYIKPNMKVICVPFASELHWQLQGDFTEYMNQHFSVFKSFGIPKENISIVRLTDDRNMIMDQIIDSDIIFFSGGFMENFMYITKMLNLKGFFQLLREHRLFIGESAGTLVMLNNYMEVPYIEDAYKHYVYQDGLGLLYGYNLMVHYNKDDVYHQKNKRVLEEMDVGKTIGLTDNSLLIVDNGETYLLGDYEV